MSVFSRSIVFLNTRVFLLFSVQHKTGLPISTYFSAVKLRWLLDNVDEVRQAVLSGRALFGTVDSWIIWVRAAPHNTDSLWLQYAKFIIWFPVSQRHCCVQTWPHTP